MFTAVSRTVTYCLALYRAVSLAPVPPLFSGGGLAPYLHAGYASFGLIVFITGAAIAHLSLFDSANRPLGSVYIGACLGVGAVVAGHMVKYGTGVQQPSTVGP